MTAAAPPGQGHAATAGTRAWIDGAARGNP